MVMSRGALVVLVLLSIPSRLFGQSVTLNGSLNVASAQDFASRVLQDPWDMNERTDFGWFLNGVDNPVPDMTNVSFTGGVFSATTGTSANLFLLETPNPNAARLGKTGGNYPIDANTYRLFAIHMNVNGSPSAALTWNRENIWDGTTTYSNLIPLRSGWAVYLVDLPTLGTRLGSLGWNGLIKSLIFNPSFSPQNVQIDWIRLVDVNPAQCRLIALAGFGGANVDLYLDIDATPGNGNESFLAGNVPSNSASASAGCSPAGAGYSFYAGALSPGTYRVLARPAGGTGSFTQSGSAYVVNDIPLLTITAPSDEGSADDFATTQLGNAWDMNATTDIAVSFNITGQTITSIPAETPAGTPLGNVNVFWAQSTPAAPPAGDPIVAPLWQSPAPYRIDPLRYRILTVEFGLPNLARSVNGGSVARIVWRVVGDTDSVSDDIVFSSRLGANVMDKVTLDMADRVVLPIEQGSTIGWVRGSTGQGIDRFRFDPHEFPAATPFYIRRIKLAALEHVAVGANYTIQWTASKSSGTVTVYYDTDRDPSNGRTLIGSAATSGGSLVWTPNVPPGEYFISFDINDGQGNTNAVYSRWPIAVDPGPPPPPVNFRIIG